MNAIDKKIKKARDNLSQGIHDPVIMEEIDLMSEILTDYIIFEDKLRESNMDID